MSNSGQQTYNFPSSNNGSLPDLSNLHIPSPLSVAIDQDEQQQQQQYNQNFSATNSNVFMSRQPRRNTTGSSCKRQVYWRHPTANMEHLQMSGGYMFQQPANNTSNPTSPTISPMYQAPMSPLANGPGYLQYPTQLGGNNLQQQLDKMATIAETMRPPMGDVSNDQMGQCIPPQSPNTFLNMLTQNPVAMENVRQRFQDYLGNVDIGENNTLASDIGNAIGGFDGLPDYQRVDANRGDYQGVLTLQPLDLRDIGILTGQSGDVAKPEVEEQLRREGNQQQVHFILFYLALSRTAFFSTWWQNMGSKLVLVATIFC